MNSKELQRVDIQVPVDSLDGYIHRVNCIPTLTLEEEQELGRKLKENDDLQAAQRLVTSHLRYVVRVAKGYMGYGLQLSDLIQEGTIGLMKAVKRFEPERKVRLVSFAVHWIKSEIHEFILKNWRIVKIATTKAQRKLFFNLRSSKKRLGWFTQEEVLAVAQDLGVKPEEVLQMEQRLNALDIAFDAPSSIEDSDTPVLPAPSDYLAAPDDSDPMQKISREGWQQHAEDQFEKAFVQLDARSKDILEKRWLIDDKKTTLKDLAEAHGVSTERVRQIEKQAIEKIKKLIEE